MVQWTCSPLQGHFKENAYIAAQGQQHLTVSWYSNKNYEPIVYHLLKYGWSFNEKNI